MRLLVLTLLSGCYPWVGADLHETNNPDCRTKETWFLDTDNDGFGDDEQTTKECLRPTDYSEVGGDCDPGDDTVNPDALEVEDGVDNNCDGIVDEGTPAFDDDGDGFSENDGDCDDADVFLNPADVDFDLVSTCDGDCDDQNASRYPGNSEICDGLDNDCVDGVPDDEADVDADGAQICAGDCDDNDPDVGPFDNDGDGFTACGVPADCDDNDPNLSPEDSDADGTSTCSGDCDDSDPGLNGIDVDGDGFTTCDGDCADLFPDLNLDDADGDGFTTCDGDCDDADPMAYPADFDGDGWDTCADGDCDDADAAVHPGIPDPCDGVDNDCDGGIDEDGAPDLDGDGFNLCQGDCDELDEAVYPGAVEICDGVDSDCDTVLPPSEIDGDGDGDPACSDCDDADPSRHSEALELCNGVDDNCSGLADEGCVTCTLLVPTDQPTVQDGINTANAGDVVCVEPGTYSENLVFTGREIHLAGIDGPLTTAIDAQGVGSVLTLAMAETAATVIEGLTLTGGAATDGAGIHISGVAAPTLRRLIIEGNDATNFGGGIYTEHGQVLWEDLIIRQNTAAEGGGIYALIDDGNGAIDLRDSLLSENVASQYGGGITAMDIQLQGVRFYGNSATVNGGALYGKPLGNALARSVVGSDIRVAGNTAEGGGGFYLGPKTSMDVTDSTFRANTAGNGGALGMDSGDGFPNDVQIRLTRVTVTGNSATQGDGGGLHAVYRSVIPMHTTFSSNTANQGGGAVHCDSCEVWMTDSVVSNNIGLLASPGGMNFPNTREMTLEDVLITGNIGGANGRGGGGVYLHMSFAYLFADLKNLVITENRTDLFGGGLFLEQGSMVILLDNLVVANNQAARGGGIYIGSGLGDFEIAARNLIVTGNSAERGGGITVDGTQQQVALALENSAVSGNTADSNGGGIYAQGSQTTSLRNVVVTNNIAVTGGGIDAGGADIQHCDFWNNQPDNFNGMPDPTGTSGNLSADPLFTDTTALDSVDWDLHLQLTSPLIDTGDPSIDDPDGQMSDIGPYGGPGANAWDLDWDGYEQWWEPGPWPGGNSDCDDWDPDVFPGFGC